MRTHLFTLTVIILSSINYSIKGESFYQQWDAWTKKNQLRENQITQNVVDYAIPYNGKTDTTKNLQDIGRELLLIALPYNNIIQDDISNPYSQTTNRFTSFKDFQGDIPSIAHDIVAYLKNPESAPQINAVVFHGATGAGKTLLARAIAGESDADMYEMAGSEPIHKYIGTGAHNIRSFFAAGIENARKGNPTILFIDEIEELAGRRTDDNRISESCLATQQLLLSLDTLEDNPSLVFIGATNIKEKLDPAFSRRVRLVEMPLPTKESRLKILEFHGKKIGFSDTTYLTNLAQKTPDFTGAELKEIIKRAHQYAYKARTAISAKECEQAFKEVKELQAQRIKKEENLKNSEWWDCNGKKINTTTAASTLVSNVVDIPYKIYVLISLICSKG